MLLARHQRQYPRIALPANTGIITPGDVLAASAGAERDAAIGDWCRSVWDAFGESRETIVEFLEACDIG